MVEDQQELLVKPANICKFFVIFFYLKKKKPSFSGDDDRVKYRRPIETEIH